ncbi:MAG TPA: serine hydrolase [Candidatus Binataceae bacterium]|nr:serine hydrolase [Candidatus Binataceae bacterium]
MRHGAAASGVIILMICSGAAAGIGPGANTRIDSIAAAAVNSGRAAGIVVGVIAGGDQRIYAHGETVRGSGLTPDGATIFELGSITKTFTATLLALYARQGIVRLDDPLQNYVPPGITVPVWDDRQITLLDLATHTAGLPKDPPLFGIRHLSDRRMYQLLDGYQLKRPPGQQFEYSNWGFALLAHALTRAAGSRYYQPLVERDICLPLGMTDTRVELTPAEIPRRAQGYRKDGFLARFEMPTWPAFNGAGALRSTMNDMLRYLAFNMGLTSSGLASLLPTLQRRWHPTMRAGGYVGLAWQMMPLRGTGLTVIWKDGGTLGFSSFIAFVRETGTGVVVLVNQSFPAARVALPIIRILNRQPEQAAPEEGGFETPQP